MLLKTFSGPCSANEVFFPAGENISSGIGSCYYINPTGKTRFHETNEICLASSTQGSIRSSYGKRDGEFHLLKGATNFLYITSDTTKR